MKVTTAQRHVEGNYAHELRELLQHYGIEGVHVRVCGENVMCCVVTEDERDMPRFVKHNTWVERVEEAKR